MSRVLQGKSTRSRTNSFVVQSGIVSGGTYLNKLTSEPANNTNCGCFSCLLGRVKECVSRTVLPEVIFTGRTYAAEVKEHSYALVLDEVARDSDPHAHWSFSKCSCRSTVVARFFVFVDMWYDFGTPRNSRGSKL